MSKRNLNLAKLTLPELNTRLTQIDEATQNLDSQGNLAQAGGGLAGIVVKLGDTLYGLATGLWQRLAGNTTTTKKYLSMTGDGTNAAVPSWAQVAVGDLSGLAANVGTFLGTPSSANLRAALTDETGTGADYFQGGDLGTPSAGVLTNATGLPISTGVAGLGTNVAAFLATPSSANLAAALTDEIGSGAVTFTTTWATPGYASGDFTSDAGSWTVASGDVQTYRYIIIGKLMTVIFWLNTTSVSGSPSELRIAIPASRTAGGVQYENAYFYSDNGGTYTVGNAVVVASGTYIKLFKTGFTGTWAAATDTTTVRGQITFEVT